MPEYDPSSFEPSVQFDEEWGVAERHQMALTWLHDEAERLLGIHTNEWKQTFHSKWDGNDEIQAMVGLINLHKYGTAHHILLNVTSPFEEEDELKTYELFMPIDAKKLCGSATNIQRNDDAWRLTENSGPFFEHAGPTVINLVRGKKYKIPFVSLDVTPTDYSLNLQANFAKTITRMLAPLCEYTIEEDILVNDPRKRV